MIYVHKCNIYSTHHWNYAAVINNRNLFCECIYRMYSNLSGTNDDSDSPGNNDNSDLPGKYSGNEKQSERKLQGGVTRAQGLQEGLQDHQHEPNK